MEAASIPEQPEPEARPRRRSVGSYIWDNILPVMLGVALLYFLVHDFDRTFDDLKTGLSNGTIWALIALGYTLVYGIIELINFAHGEVFMIGSFVATSIWQAAHLHDNPPAGTAIVWILLVLPVAMFASGSLNVLIERVAYRPLRNAPKL